MSSYLRKRLGFAAVVVIAAALAFAGPSIIAGITDTASAAGGCGMTAASTSGTCSMDAEHKSCGMLAGTVTSIDKPGGSVTVKLKPAAVGGDAGKKALSRVKVGDSLSMAIMLKSDGSPASPAVQSAKYACPMHPEVTSDKPAKCSKCGMNLERVGR